MVKKRLFLAFLAAVLFFSAMSAAVCSAQTRTYSFNQEWAKIWINHDGTIDLFYNVSLTLESGEPINYVTLGQPKSDFMIGEATDQYGNFLQAERSSDGTGVRVTLDSPLTAGNTVWFTLITNVADMISPDTTNEGNLGMQFAPQWMPVPINDVRVQIVLPPNVTVNDVKTPGDKFWNSTSTESDGRLAVYWQIPVLQANEEYLFGVSVPAQYLPDYEVSTGGLSMETIGIIVGAVLVGVFAVGIIVYAARKKPYTSPKVSMETLGIRRGLTAVEASYLLDLKPTQIVTEILYSLLQKRAVWVESTNPALKLRVMPEFQNKKGPDDNPLRYYEIDFIDAVKADGTLDEEALAKTVMFLRDTLEQKLRGYSRKDTVDYYRKIVDKAWTQVEQAGTGALASKAYDKQLLWLLLDPNYQGRTQTTFTTRTFEPSPFWFWYWYGYTMYRPNPTYTPNVDVPAQSGKPPTIPGAEFANNIATSLEKTSSNIVVSLEKFADAIVPAKPPQSHQPARSKADCVCACAACACACACVSCACACAGGGVG
ncbi:MAG: hypothetical protein NWF00_12650 [Candidatus Bathyarchaeota archaeon]|nr:hypothetical protein [Candidatus Bathyarchaeota archaeon]